MPLDFAQESFDGRGVRHGVGGVGKHEGGVAELPDRAAQGVGDRAGVGERRIALGQLPGARVLQQRLATPVARQPLQEVVALDVAVVVARRRIGRVQVDHVVATRRQVEHIRRGGGAGPAAVEHDAVVLGGPFGEVFAQRKAQVAAAVVVAVAGDGEDAPGLAASRGQDQRGDGQRLPVPAHPVDMRPGGVEEAQVGSGEVDPAEGALDEVPVIGGRPADHGDVMRAERHVLVDHARPRDDRGKREEVVGGDLVAAGLEQVGHHAAAGEGVEGGGPAQVGEGPRQVRDQPVLRAHVPQPGEQPGPAHHLGQPGRWLPDHGGGHRRNTGITGILPWAGARSAPGWDRPAGGHKISPGDDDFTAAEALASGPMTPPPAQVLEHPSPPATVGEPRPGRPGRVPSWLPRGDRARAAVAVIRREWVACAFAVSAVFAAITALTSFNAPERVWGTCAAVSYGVAAVTAAAVRRRGVSLAVLAGLGGAVAAPLAWMAVTGMAQPEVGVIIRSAGMLVHQGTPYLSPAALAAAHTWRAYDPYLPALIAFGVPRALGGGLLTDPRIWFGIAFVAAFGAAVRITRVPRPVWWTVLVTASPVVALPLAVGGDDLPVLGLICLGLAL